MPQPKHLTKLKLPVPKTAPKDEDLAKYFENNPNFGGEVKENEPQKITIGIFRDYWEADTFKKYMREMGVKGIKVDFFGGDGQSMIDYYVGILRDAYDAQLLVNFHGATLPRGWSRTWPNLVTAEAVRGFEFTTFDQKDQDPVAGHAAMLPFTRNLFDPMDFTPMVFGDIPKIRRATRNGFELAESVLFVSGIQHFAEVPQGMATVPDYVKDFLRTLPARLAFLSVAAWWALFSVPLFARVRLHFEPLAFEKGLALAFRGGLTGARFGDVQLSRLTLDLAWALALDDVAERNGEPDDATELRGHGAARRDPERARSRAQARAVGEDRRDPRLLADLLDGREDEF